MVDPVTSKYSSQNVLALEACVMALTLLVEQQGAVHIGESARGALVVIGENACHIKQGFSRLRRLGIG
nr:hypothetical protein [Pseudomonas brassicacearum]